MIHLPISQIPGGAQTCAFMEMIKVSEGTSTSPITRNGGYDIIVSSIDPASGKLQLNRFDDYSDHPFAPQFNRKSLTINKNGLTSNASGGFQIMYTKFTWPAYKQSLRLPDFSPQSQELYCIQQLREQKALPLIMAGKLAEACDAVSNIWASIAGSKNTYGQPTHKFDVLAAAFTQNGGKIA